MATPIEDARVFRLICCLIVLCLFYQSLASETQTDDDSLLCRQCGHEVTTAPDLFNKPSILAKRHRNDTILGTSGVLIQLFENPSGNTFEVITSRDADIFKRDQSFAEYSWFPGFAWRMCMCPRCGYHLGWFFEPYGSDASDKEDEDGVIDTFVGLILDNLLHKNYANSLLVTPKVYKS